MQRPSHCACSGSWRAGGACLPCVPGGEPCPSRQALPKTNLPLLGGPPITPADFYVRHHFVQFLRLYHNPARSHASAVLCREHLSVLQVLARHPAGGPARTRFQQLSILDFFLREVRAGVSLLRARWRTKGGR